MSAFDISGAAQGFGAFFDEVKRYDIEASGEFGIGTIKYAFAVYDKRMHISSTNLVTPNSQMLNIEHAVFRVSIAGGLVFVVCFVGGILFPMLWSPRERNRLGVTVVSLAIITLLFLGFLVRPAAVFLESLAVLLLGLLITIFTNMCNKNSSD